MKTGTKEKEPKECRIHLENLLCRHGPGNFFAIKLTIMCLSAHVNTITKTCLFKYTEIFTTKNENFQIKNSDIFLIFAQNIDCGYSLEPPR